MKTVFFTSCYGETRGALAENDWIVEFFLERETSPSLFDAVFCGRVIEHHKPLGWAIIDLGNNRQGFLPVKKKYPFPPIGEKILVQSLDHSAHHEAGHYLLKLTTQISFGNNLLVFMPSRNDIQVSASTKSHTALPEHIIPALEALDFTGIVRQGALTVSSKILSQAVEQQKNLWQTTQFAFDTAQTPQLLHKPHGWLKWLYSLGTVDALVVEPGFLSGSLVQELKTQPSLNVQTTTYGEPSFIEELEEAWATMHEQTVPLSDGGRLHIYETPAATIIDVDSAQAQGTDVEQVHFRVNLTAATEAFRQMRLRQLKGTILVDFITLKTPGLRKQLEQKLKSLAKTFPNSHFHGLSALGIAEIVRESRTYSLSQQLLVTMPATPSPETIAFQILRTAKAHPVGKPLKIEGHPQILGLFQNQLHACFTAFESERAAPVTLIPKQVKDDMIDFAVSVSHSQ